MEGVIKIYCRARIVGGNSSLLLVGILISQIGVIRMSNCCSNLWRIMADFVLNKMKK